MVQSIGSAVVQLLALCLSSAAAASPPVEQDSKPTADQQALPSVIDGRAVLAMGTLTKAEVRMLRVRRKALCRAAPKDGRELVFAVKATNDPDRWLTASYVLARFPQSPQAFGEIDNSLLSATGKARLKPAELLFHWEDEQRQPSGRGKAIAELTIVSMTNEAAMAMRQLTRELVATHMPGLADMARKSGYYREAMALARDGQDRTYLLVYLELTHPEMRKRLRSQAPTEFMRWWAPRFLALVNMSNGGSARTIARCTLAD